jgi:hypothetical protein
MKYCPGCKKKKSDTAFAKNCNRERGLQDYCRICMSTRVKQSKIKHPGTRKKSLEAWYNSIEGRASRLASQAKERAKRFNVPYRITPAWVTGKLQLNQCDRTGLPFDLQTSGFGKFPHIKSFAPSLHRVIPKKGYTKTNTELVCWIYNRAVGATPVADVLLMAKALIKKQIK